jgi:hypothetical protein
MINNPVEQPRPGRYESRVTIVGPGERLAVPARATTPTPWRRAPRGGRPLLRVALTPQAARTAPFLHDAMQGPVRLDSGSTLELHRRRGRCAATGAPVASAQRVSSSPSTKPLAHDPRAVLRRD